MIPDPTGTIHRLREFQKQVRDVVVKSHTSQQSLHEVSRISSADTIYKIDTDVDPILESFCEDWSRTTPLVLIAEGLEDSTGTEVPHRVFPHGTKESDAPIRVIVDPIDGTRGIMYDKRPAWSLAGVAPNHGSATKLRDIEIAVMTELPTSKMGSADVLWATRSGGGSGSGNGGAAGARENLSTGQSQPLRLAPSQAGGIDHGFAMISNFFPGTKVLSAELMEHLARHLIGPADVTRATVFEDQYISTGGQFYELIIGHDRFNADLRPTFYHMQNQPEGLCCHPYDCATMLIAEEAGVILTDPLGNPLDGPLDVTTGIAWTGYANATLRDHIAPLLTQFLRVRGFRQ